MLSKLLWPSFLNVCKSTHYVVHLKIMQCYRSQENLEQKKSTNTLNNQGATWVTSGC